VFILFIVSTHIIIAGDGDFDFGSAEVKDRLKVMRNKSILSRGPLKIHSFADQLKLFRDEHAVPMRDLLTANEDVFETLDNESGILVHFLVIMRIDCYLVSVSKTQEKTYPTKDTAATLLGVYSGIRQWNNRFSKLTRIPKAVDMSDKQLEVYEHLRHFRGILETMDAHVDDVMHNYEHHALIQSIDKE